MDRYPEPDKFPFEPRLSAGKDPYPTTSAGILDLAPRALAPRARTRAFALKQAFQPVRPAQRTCGPCRSVLVKIKTLMRTSGTRASLTAHVRYVAREGAGENLTTAKFFDADADAPDPMSSAKQWAEDRRHYRIVINPEDGRDLPDIRTFARSLMKEIGTDLLHRGFSDDWTRVWLRHDLSKALRCVRMLGFEAVPGGIAELAAVLGPLYGCGALRSGIKPSLPLLPEVVDQTICDLLSAVEAAIAIVNGTDQ